MKLKILMALLRKEFILMRRNPIIPKIIFVMPLMVMLVIPLVANLDVKNVEVTVVDNDRTPLSRRIIADMEASDFLRVMNVCSTHDRAMITVEKGDADVVLTIPDDFMKEVASHTSRIDVEANGVNATKGMLGSQYVAQSVMLSLIHI